MTLAILPGEPSRPGVCHFSQAYPSRIECQAAAVDAAGALILDQGWVNVEDRQWLRLCLDEAITNAIFHGNEGDPDLEFTVSVHADDDRWWVLVGDRGTGFTATSVPDPERPESVLLEHGRGILIMRSWLDELSYHRGGSCAALSRRRVDHGRERG